MGGERREGRRGQGGDAGGGGGARGVVVVEKPYNELEKYSFTFAEQSISVRFKSPRWHLRVR